MTQLIPLLLLITTCLAQFNLKASTDNTDIANKTICMNDKKAVLLFPPDNSCVFTFRGGILTAYTTNGIIFNQGDQLTESDSFRGSQILFRNSVLDPPNNWQFTACPENGNSWSVWMDGTCEGGVTFEAVLTQLDDEDLKRLEEGVSTTSEINSSTSQPSSTSSDCSCDDKPRLSTRTITEVVTVSGEDASGVTEVTTTRTVTLERESSTAGVVTVTHHVTNFVSSSPTSGNQNNSPDVNNGQISPGTSAPAPQVASPANPTPQPPNPSPDWNVGALPSGENGVDIPANPTPANNAPEAPKHTIWWTQPSSPWWTQQTAPWWTPETVWSNSATSKVSGTSTASGSAQENGVEMVKIHPLTLLITLITIHITFF